MNGATLALKAAAPAAAVAPTNLRNATTEAPWVRRTLKIGRAHV